MKVFKDIQGLFLKHGYTYIMQSVFGKHSVSIRYRKNNYNANVLLITPDDENLTIATCGNCQVGRVTVEGPISDNNLDKDITLSQEELGLLDKVLFIQNNPLKHLPFLFKTYSKAIVKFESTFLPVLKEIGYDDFNFSLFTTDAVLELCTPLSWHCDEDIMFNINVITGKLEIFGDIVTSCYDAMSLTQEDFRNLLK